MRSVGKLSGFVTEQASSPGEVDEKFTRYCELSGFAFLDPRDGFIAHTKRTFGEISLNRGQSSGHRATTQSEGSFNFMMLLAGRATIVSRNGTHVVRPGQVLIGGAGVHINIALPGSEWLNVAVRDAGAETGPDEDRSPVPSTVSDRSARIGADLAGLFSQLPEAEKAGRLDQAVGLWALRLRSGAAQARALEAGALPNARTCALRQVRLAEERMHASFRTPLAIGTLAATLGISSRALQLAYARHRGMSPHAHLTLIRAEAVRQRLTSPAEGECISQIVLDCGFAHMGRFAALYRRLYGERPSQTLRRALSGRTDGFAGWAPNADSSGHRTPRAHSAAE